MSWRLAGKEPGLTDERRRRRTRRWQRREADENFIWKGRTVGSGEGETGSVLMIVALRWF